MGNYYCPDALLHGSRSHLQQYIKDKKLINWLIYSQLILGVLGGFGAIAILFHSAHSAPILC